MKLSTKISLLIFLAAIYLTYHSYFPTSKEEIDNEANYRKDNPDAIPSHFEICRTVHSSPETSPLLTYRGSSLISKSTDNSDLVFCPGDTFGDLNGTYVTLQDCYLTIYHQVKPLWSSPKDDKFGGSKFLCAATLGKDGSITLWKEGWQCYGTMSGLEMHFYWGSNTDFYPKQTELRVCDQQVQLVQTFQDGTQRMFYTGENIREFREDLGAPKQVAEKFLLKSHNGPNDSVILGRNEYIGDLNGMHLILQTNCELQLKNKSKTIWSFAAYLKIDERCDLRIEEDLIRISGFDNQHRGTAILTPNYFTVRQSNVSFSGDQLLITQTLKNGSEIFFYSEPGQDNGLKFKRELRQIAQNNMTISSWFTLQRLDYIGNLNDLHLILQDNCALTLANGQQELWKLTKHLEPGSQLIKNLDGPFMECSIQFKDDGTIMLNRRINNNEWNPEILVFGERSYKTDDHPSRFQLFLENNLMIMTLEDLDKTPKIYHAGAKTNGTWFRLMSASSIIINVNDTADEILPTMGYIGDIHGVFTMLDQRGNWILFNKTQVLWESGTTQEIESSDFYLVSTKDGAIAITLNWNWSWEEKWSTRCQTVSLFPQAAFSKTELLVSNDGMWLINTFVDGSVDKYKALEGTNQFIHMPNEYAPIEI